MSINQEIIKDVIVDNKIFIIRGLQVMIDKDLAELYQVEARRLREQVKRNIKRFPDDFMFQLTSNELDSMVSQNATPSKKYFGGSLPYAFTENGIAMLSSILKSDTAINVNIQIMRTFTKLKNLSVPYFDIIKRLERLEANDKDTKNLLDKVVQVVSSMQTIQNEAKESTSKIGFIK